MVVHSPRYPAIAGIAWLFLVAASLPLMAADAGVATAEVNGLVVSPRGQPIADTTIRVVAIAPRASSNLAECYLASGIARETVTAENGRFAIRDLEPAEFALVTATAENYKSRSWVVEAKSENSLTLRMPPLEGSATVNSVSVEGRVLDPDGKPVGDAVVLVTGFRIQQQIEQVNSTLVRDAAITDSEGQFSLETELQQPRAMQVCVSVDAAGSVPHQPFALSSRSEANTLQLVAGTRITGRVLRDARPAAGVAIAIAELSPVTGELTTSHETITSADGRFAFEQVRPKTLFQLFPLMAPLASENLAAFRRAVHSGPVGNAVESAEVNLHTGHRIRGQLVFLNSTAGSLLTPADWQWDFDGVRAVLTRCKCDDSQEVDVKADGSFEFQGVPSDTVAVSLHGPRRAIVPGYRLSSQQYNFDQLSKAELFGRVDDDLNLNVLFEPGEAPPPQAGRRNQPVIQQMVAVRQMVGGQLNVQMVAVQQVGPGQALRVVQPGPTSVQEWQPLRGAPAELLERLEWDRQRGAPPGNKQFMPPLQR